jgi:flagellar biosynthetic protein FlhB
MSDKTEKATDKKIKDEIKRGNVAQSREVSTFTGIIALIVLISIIVPNSVGSISNALIPFVDTPDDIPASNFGDTLALAWWLTQAIGAGFIFFIIATMALGLVGAVAQGKIVFTSERIRPKFNKISPMAGIKRLVSLNNLIEFIKGVAKISMIALITAIILIPHFSSADRMVGLPAETLMPAIKVLSLKLLGGVALFSGLLAILDRFYKKYEWEKRLMMTKHDVKEEAKQNDGDPHVKAKRRDRARMMAKQRMMSRVPSATFIVTNPTHFAVALRYIPGETDVPVCVAKGIDHVALKIREIASGKDIPVIENPPLARALHATSELEKPINEQHFEAVAQVVNFVMALNGRAGTIKYPGAGV